MPHFPFPFPLFVLTGGKRTQERDNGKILYTVPVPDMALSTLQTSHSNDTRVKGDTLRFLRMFDTLVPDSPLTSQDMPFDALISPLWGSL